MHLVNSNNQQEYTIDKIVYENEITKILGGFCKLSNKKQAFVKIYKYGEIEDKVFRNQLLETAKQEANTLKKIKDCSKRVPELIDAWDNTKERQYIIVMSKVPGISLREWMNKHSKEILDEKDVFLRTKIIEQTCEIMKDVTNKNTWLVHRDLKPENIYIDFNTNTKRWEVYIIDFGCANINHIRNVGTTNYQAPEQLGIKDAGVKICSAVDVFAIGQIYYELLLKQAPVIDVDYTRKAGETEWNHTPELPSYLLQFDGVKTLYDIISKMTAFNAEKRLTYERIIPILKNTRIIKK